ncbi:hypothetical protein BD626DRAFT_495343 [Schizophyllum amplum]|uniref:Uncharacterized protein n=1 Tax=Schizophyllum amplum TaxID=97359 RepID=A0A550CE30_9AGAR|nr:hypothetical protein BD626DRAFT_495343 [Auriculariopsis ampla]
MNLNRQIFAREVSGPAATFSTRSRMGLGRGGRRAAPPRTSFVLLTRPLSSVRHVTVSTVNAICDPERGVPDAGCPAALPLSGECHIFWNTSKNYRAHFPSPQMTCPNRDSGTACRGYSRAALGRFSFSLLRRPTNCRVFRSPKPQTVRGSYALAAVEPALRAVDSRASSTRPTNAPEPTLSTTGQTLRTAR